jgi:hypothetical protein
MLTTIRGIYEQGRVVLKEKAPVNDTTEVIITFLTEEKVAQPLMRLRMPGGLQGKVTIPDDFNAPLEDLKDYM